MWCCYLPPCPLAEVEGLDTEGKSVSLLPVEEFRR